MRRQREDHTLTPAEEEAWERGPGRRPRPPRALPGLGPGRRPVLAGAGGDRLRDPDPGSADGGHRSGLSRRAGRALRRPGGSAPRRRARRLLGGAPPPRGPVHRSGVAAPRRRSASPPAGPGSTSTWECGSPAPSTTSCAWVANRRIRRSRCDGPVPRMPSPGPGPRPANEPRRPRQANEAAAEAAETLRLSTAPGPGAPPHVRPRRARSDGGRDRRGWRDVPPDADPPQPGGASKTSGAVSPPRPSRCSTPDLPLYPTPTPEHCAACDFRAPCLAMNDGGRRGRYAQNELPGPPPGGPRRGSSRCGHLVDEPGRCASPTVGAAQSEALKRALRRHVPPVSTLRGEPSPPSLRNHR